MKKTVFFLAATALISSSCARQSLSVEGDILNLPDGNLYMAVIDSNFRPVVIDTTKVVDGKFKFDSQKSFDYAECIIITNQKDVDFPIFAGNDRVTIEGDINKLEDLKVEGSSYNETMRLFGKNMPETDRLNKLRQEYQATRGNIDRSQMIKEEMENIQREQLAYVKKTIQNNISSPVGPFLLSNYMRFYSFEEVEALVDSFSQTMPDYKYVRTLARIVEKSRPENEANKLIEIGKTAPDFTLLDTEGNPLKLSSLQGQHVLLTFWASWCQPCRENNKSLSKIYEKLESQGSGIIYVFVSVDANKADWLKAVNEDQVPGYQLIDSKNIVSEIYMAKKLPCTYLIDPDGRIVAKDTVGKNIFDKFGRTLAKEKEQK